MPLRQLEKSWLELTELIGTYPSVPEKELLQEFDTCWKEFQKIDQQVLEFAVQNTNLKAARLSFGAASTARNDFGHALSGLISESTSGPICRLVYDAQTAALRIHVLHAPHIASPDDHEMDGIEKAIRQNDAVVRKSLSDVRLLLPPAKKVVENATSILIVFADGTESEGTIISAQPENDIAVLQAQTLPELFMPATLGNPGAMQVGDDAYVVGNPFGLYGSMSAGVISGFNRTFNPPGREPMEGLIQFDAAANPGNSGGPLLNRSGQVIGIVTGLVNPTDDSFFVGICFAVPIATAGGAVGLPPY